MKRRASTAQVVSTWRAAGPGMWGSCASRTAGWMWPRPSTRGPSGTSADPRGLPPEVIAEVGWPVPAGLAAGPWRGTPGLTSRPERIGAERLFVLGDAAGYVEPFTGEGIAWALTSARALCPLALRAVERWDPGFPALWAALHRRALGPRRLCHASARLLRSPLLTGVLVRLLAKRRRWPGPSLRRSTAIRRFRNLILCEDILPRRRARATGSGRATSDRRCARPARRWCAMG